MIKYFILLIYLSTSIFTFCKRENKLNLSNGVNITVPEDKIWGHRVNSLTDIEARINDFKGVEVDIFYNPSKNNFEVKHDLEEAGIDLAYYLDSVLKCKNLLFWFDYKNLNIETDQGIKKIYSILSERNLINQCFIESYYVNQLEKFNNKINTSLWVSNTNIPNSKKERDQLYIKKYKAFEGKKITMLSASFEMFEFLTEYFPNKKCNYWMSGELSDEKIKALKKMAKSSSVNIILIDGHKNFLKQKHIF